MMSRLHRLDICMRSFFVQASWNPERMQNVGFLFAIRGPLKRIWRHDAGQFVASCERALSFINTHPYFAPAVMGMTLHVEEKVASGAAPAGSIDALKLRVTAPLNALGSLWFWDHLRLLAFLIALPFVISPDPAVAVSGVALFFLAFNYFHLTTRWRGLTLGLRHGADMMPFLLSMFPSSALQTVRRLCVFFLGLLTPIALASVAGTIESRLPPLPTAIGRMAVFSDPMPVAVGVVCVSVVLMTRRWISVYSLLAAGLLLAVGVARWA